MVTLRNTATALACTAAAVVLFAGCGSTSLTSTYHDKPFTIDGDPKDWVGSPLYVDKSGINVAISHDADYLYVMVSTTDRTKQSQIRRGGFTVWFDPTGGSAKTFGIRYPMGMPGGPPPSMDDALAPPGDGEMDMPSPGRIDHIMKSDMELLGPDDEDRLIVSLLSEKQIQAKIIDASGGLTYELRVPLQHDAAHPHGIGIQPGKNLGVSLQTKQMEGMRGGPGIGPRGGGEGGQGGMMPPGGGDMQGEGGMQGGGGGRGSGGGRGPGGGMRGERGSESHSSPIDISLNVVLTR
jgi:hypothetical protein